MSRPDFWRPTEQLLIAALAWNLKTWMLNLLSLAMERCCVSSAFCICGYAKRGWWQRLGVACCSNCLTGEYYQRHAVKRSPRLAALSGLDGCSC